MRLLLILCIAWFCLLPVQSWAEIHAANSTEYSDVYEKVSFANSGDTVIVPAGSSTWNSPLVITKGINLKGDGIGATVITGNINNRNVGLVNYEPSNPALNEPFMLSGFTFDGSLTSMGVTIKNTSLIPLTKVRIALCRFTRGNYIGLKITGPVYGVADHNQYAFNKDDTEVISYDQKAYDNLVSSYGTADAFFFEASIFEGSDMMFQNSNAAQFVFRHNTIMKHSNVQMMDLHGNNHDPVIPGYTKARAPLNAEVYGNVFNSIRSSAGHMWMLHRGGSLLMYDNTIVGTSINSFIRLAEYDDFDDNLIPVIVRHNSTSYICKQDHTATAVTEPGTLGGLAYWDITAKVPDVYVTWTVGHLYRFSTSYDPVIDTYFYNNTENGNPVPVLFNNVADQKYIVKNINYWLTDPRTQTIKGRIYTPYVYPHPLTVLPIINGEEASATIN